ncbi:MAG: TIGR01777 family oxidoreductase [Kordiimonas sp.]
MRILMTGATGFIGTNLCKFWEHKGYEVTALVRNLDTARRKIANARLVTSLKEIKADEKIDAIVNLAGAPIAGGLWTKKYRTELLNSRVLSTNDLIVFVRKLHVKPKVMINASAAGFYGRRGTELLDEHEAPQTIFMSTLCKDWEAAATSVEQFGVRLVIPRISVVLGNDGGAFPKLVHAMKFGMGAITGSGKQYFPWIHKTDLIKLFDYMLETETLSGPVNAVAPDPCTNAYFNKAIARTLRRPLMMRIPEPILRFALREMADLFVAGQHMSASKVLGAGFEFQYPKLDDALKDLLNVT